MSSYHDIIMCPVLVAKIFQLNAIVTMLRHGLRPEALLCYLISSAKSKMHCI